MSLAGKNIGRYRIIEELGKGGMAIVYKAYDPENDREVAIKLIEADEIPKSRQNNYLRRFEREADAQVNFDHPYIVPAYEYGNHEGAPYLVMAYWPGGTLRKYVGRRMPYQKAAAMLAPIADALAYAHNRDLIHRDVKPTNILFDENGTPALADFGVAKLESAGDETALTASGLGVGTPQYMAPEQWNGKTVKATDMYALGVVFYELITGRRPYLADSTGALAIAQATEPLPPPTDFVPDLPDVVVQVLYTVLAKEPENRFASMDEFTQVLKLLVEGGADEKIWALLPAMPTSGEISTDQLPVTDPAVRVDFPEPSQAEPRKAKSGFPLWAWGVIGVAVIAVVVGGIWGIFQFAGNQASTAAGEPTSPGVAALDETVGLAEDTEAPVAAAAGTALPENTVQPTFTMQTEPTLAQEPTPTVFQTATPISLAAGTIQTNATDGAPIVFIPSTEFTMGLTEDQVSQLTSRAQDCLGSIESSTPAHQVYLDAYWIYQTEVTNGMYQQCVSAGACEKPTKTDSVYRSSYYGNSQFDEYPVVMVSWQDADNYCQWAGGRLPTSAEWEYAARGDDGRLFPWGNETPTVFLANFDLQVGDTEPVTDWPEGVSPFGLYHMAGNVFEWVNDWYSSRYYEISPYANPTGPANTTLELSRRVLRGGSWEFDLGCASSAVQDYWDEAEQGWGVGFRCVVPVE